MTKHEQWQHYGMDENERFRVENGNTRSVFGETGTENREKSGRLCCARSGWEMIKLQKANKRSDNANVIGTVDWFKLNRRQRGL